MLDDTHDPELRSWVESANEPATDFPIQNLPFGRFRRAGTDEPLRIGVAIGDQVLDLKLALENSPWTVAHQALLQPLADGDLNAFMALGAAARRELRSLLSKALREGSQVAPFLELCVLPQGAAEMACRAASATTPTSTPASTTRPRSASCSGPTIRCCRTTSGCRSATTAAPRRSSSAASAFGGRSAR